MYNYRGRENSKAWGEEEKPRRKTQVIEIPIQVILEKHEENLP